MAAGLDVPLEQRMSALKRANKIRTHRARLKKQVAAGEVPYDTLLKRGWRSPLLQSMKVEEALRCMPAIGPKKTVYIMRTAGISQSKTLGGLTALQWQRLYIALNSYPGIRRRLSEASANVKS